MTNSEVGTLGQEIAYELWPDLTPGTEAEDLLGIDARDAQKRGVQIKTDRLIADTGRIFWEIAKRNGDWNDYGSGTEWHGATSAHVYVFVTRGAAYRVTVQALIRAAAGRNARIRRRGTAFGFVLPLASLTGETRSHRRDLG